MEKALFTEKVDSMLPSLMEAIRKECDRLYRCGGVDPASYGEDFALPKLILYVALENLGAQYKPRFTGYRRDAENLKHF